MANARASNFSILSPSISNICSWPLKIDKHFTLIYKRPDSDRADPARNPDRVAQFVEHRSSNPNVIMYTAISIKVAGSKPSRGGLSCTLSGNYDISHLRTFSPYHITE